MILLLFIFDFVHLIVVICSRRNGTQRYIHTIREGKISLTKKNHLLARVVLMTAYFKLLKDAEQKVNAAQMVAKDNLLKSHTIFNLNNEFLASELKRQVTVRTQEGANNVYESLLLCVRDAERRGLRECEECSRGTCGGI